LPTGVPVLELSEEMRVRRANRQQLSPLLQLQLKRAAERTVDRLDGADVNDDAAVNLPEHFRVQFFLHFLEARVEQERARARGERGVLGVSSQVPDLRGSNHAPLVQVRHGEPFDVLILAYGGFLQQLRQSL